MIVMELLMDVWQAGAGLLESGSSNIELETADHLYQQRCSGRERLTATPKQTA